MAPHAPIINIAVLPTTPATNLLETSSIRNRRWYADRVKTVISLTLLLVAGCSAWLQAIQAGGSFAWIDAENSPVVQADAQSPDMEPSDDAASVTSPAGLPIGKVFVNDHTFQVEIAATYDARLTGLMGRESLAPDAGMLFVFEQPQHLSFWMKDTLIPLDIAFIRANGTIESIDTMQPLTLNSHRSGEAVPLALEIPAGTFERLDITPNDQVTIVGLK